MERDELLEEATTKSIIGAFYEVYNTLGFGFLEKMYVKALEIELLARGHRVRREVPVHAYYKGHDLGLHRLDLVVDDKVLVETKSDSQLHKRAPKILRSYLHAIRLRVALLLHFGPEPKFYRVLAPREDPPPSRSG